MKLCTSIRGRAVRRIARVTTFRYTHNSPRKWITTFRISESELGGYPVRAIKLTKAMLNFLPSSGFHSRNFKLILSLLASIFSFGVLLHFCKFLPSQLQLLPCLIQFSNFNLPFFPFKFNLRFGWASRIFKIFRLRLITKHAGGF